MVGVEALLISEQGASVGQSRSGLQHFSPCGWKLDCQSDKVGWKVLGLPEL